MGAKVTWRENRKAWFLYVYANGTQKAKRLGPANADKRRGERLAREVERAQAKGALGLEKREKPTPFNAFADRWFQQKLQIPLQSGESELAPATVRMREETIRLHLKPFLGKTDLREISVETIDALWAYWLQRGKPKSRNSRRIAIGTLRLILADAIAKKILSAGANAVDVWKAVQPKGRRSGTGTKPVDEARILDPEERECLLETAHRLRPDYYPFILFLAETGCRIGEARTLRWGDVDLKRGSVTLTRHKTGGKRTEIELSPRIVRALKAARPDIVPPETHCFPSQGETAQQRSHFRFRVWNPIVQAAFGTDRRVTPHMLRHTWASLHIARGTPLKWIQRQGGWSSAKVLLDTYGWLVESEQSGYAANLEPRSPPGPSVRAS